MAEFNGLVALQFHKNREAIHLAKVEENGFPAKYAGELAKVAEAEIDARKCGLDRWTFYFEGLSQEVKEGDMIDKNTLSFTAAKRLFKAAKDWEITLDKGRYGKPRLTFHNPDAEKRSSRPKVNETIDMVSRLEALLATKA